ncbi:hypothetical protein P171DRAFT_485958 [Karstenula rhodostoma CBS 690.94]|uniref:Uncharacterized protein n=1 Tax=Karstenula rhodostoma CBS 690.94 TaxID=1392251 RepID=A0A9P4PIA5_9PLEO|nr:hypothetical protein P171DRAFT_485958 [Karstenula rhodostoma CBS 690.94]
MSKPKALPRVNVSEVKPLSQPLQVIVLGEPESDFKNNDNVDPDNWYKHTTYYIVKKSAYLKRKMDEGPEFYIDLYREALGKITSKTVASYFHIIAHGTRIRRLLGWVTQGASSVEERRVA